MRNLFNWFNKMDKKLEHDSLGKYNSIELKKYFLSLLPNQNGLILLEAGASGGDDTIEWASFPEIEKIYAFEPVQRSFEMLNNKVGENKKIETIKKALSDEEGNVDIYISSNVKNPTAVSSSSSILKPTGHIEFHEHISFQEKESVELVTIDNWARGNAVSKVDLMWLDMQGAESKALMGGKEIVRTTKLIYSEVSLKQMYEGSMLYPEYKIFMDGLGFQVEKEFLFWEDMGNVLFRRKG